MLLTALMLLTTPQSVNATPPIVQPPMPTRPAVDMPVLGGEPLHCRDVPRQVVFPAPTTTNPVGSVVQSTFAPADTNSDGRVRMYLLFDRSIAGCPVPVVAMDDLPGANRAIGREVPAQPIR